MQKALRGAPCHRRTIIKIRLLLVLSLISGADLARTSNAVAAAPEDSLQAVWASAGALYEAADFRRYYQVFSPETRYLLFEEDLTFLLSYGPFDSRRNDAEARKWRKELSAIFARYGVRDWAADDPLRPGIHSQKSVGLIPRPEALYAEIMDWLTRHRLGPRVPAWLERRFEKIECTGDKCVAVFESEVPPSSVSFARVDGRWHVDYPSVEP